MPFISYIVSAKYDENKVNLRTLNQKKFTSENFFESREKAFEYYESCIESLIDAEEIAFENSNLALPIHRKDLKSVIFKCNQENIEYKNQQNFCSGIQIHLRINQNLSMSENNVIAEGKKYLIQEFNCLDRNDLKNIENNLLMETKIYHRFKNQKNQLYAYNTIDENGYEKEIKTLFSYNRFLKSKASENFLQILKKNQKTTAEKEIAELLKSPNLLRFEQMKEHNIIELGQTVCAFLNGDEVAYIHLDYEVFPAFLKGIMDVLEDQFLEELTYVQLFDNVKIGRKNFAIIRVDGKNNRHDCTRVSAKPSDNISDYEVYHRNQFGNVLIWED